MVQPSSVFSRQTKLRWAAKEAKGSVQWTQRNSAPAFQNIKGTGQHKRQPSGRQHHWSHPAAFEGQVSPRLLDWSSFSASLTGKPSILLTYFSIHLIFNQTLANYKILMWKCFQFGEANPCYMLYYVTGFAALEYAKDESSNWWFWENGS